MKIKIKGTGRFTGSSVNVKKAEIRAMLSAIGSKIFPKSVTLFLLLAKNPSKKSESSLIDTIKRSGYGRYLREIPIFS